MKRRDFFEKFQRPVLPATAVASPAIAQSSPENQVAPERRAFRNRSTRSMAAPSRSRSTSLKWTDNKFQIQVVRCR